MKNYNELPDVMKKGPVNRQEKDSKNYIPVGFQPIYSRADSDEGRSKSKKKKNKKNSLER
jgi:hypothetical protein